MYLQFIALVRLYSQRAKTAQHWTLLEKCIAMGYHSYMAPYILIATQSVKMFAWRLVVVVSGDDDDHSLMHPYGMVFIRFSFQRNSQTLSQLLWIVGFAAITFSQRVFVEYASICIVSNSSWSLETIMMQKVFSNDYCNHWCIKAKYDSATFKLLESANLTAACSRFNFNVPQPKVTDRIFFYLS